jgi:hypothetical protein
MPSRSEVIRASDELAAVWGARQVVKRQEHDARVAPVRLSAASLGAAAAASPDAARHRGPGAPLRLTGGAAGEKAADEESASTVSFVSDTALDPEQRERKQAKVAAAAAGKKRGGKPADTRYRLHCFVAPGINKNDVREVFEGVGDPEVELRTSQKGNVLNKTHFAVMTFKNKTLALWAVKHLDGTNQRDTLGTNPMTLNLFLSRDQQKLVRRKAKRERVRR